MQPIFYDSFARFSHRIVKNWNKSETSFNAGNIQLLRYSWITKKYWSNRNGERVAKINRIDINQLKMY